MTVMYWIVGLMLVGFIGTVIWKGSKEGSGQDALATWLGIRRE